MTPRHVPLAPGVLLAVVAVLAAPPQEPPPDQTTFRATTDLVTVDVMVRTAGAPVGGLTAADFVLLDNGVPQTVESVSMEAIPVEVSILVDNNEDVSDDVGGMAEQVRKIAALLRPTDRLRLTTINSTVIDLVPATPAARAELPERLTASGLSSAHDGLIAALVRRVEPNRPHLVFALTNAIDAISSVDASTVRDVASRASATLYIVQVDVALRAEEGAPLEYISGREREENHRCAAAGLCSPTRRFWVPYDDHDFDTLREAAESTGGAMYLPGVFTDRSASAIFRKVFEDYRRSYLLRYIPRGVAREGWHELTVTMPKYPGYTVHARRGYAVDDPSRTPAPSDRIASSSGDADALIAAYDRGDPDELAARLVGVTDWARLIERIGGGPPWPSNPRREAAFVIELAHAAVFSRRGTDRAAGRRLLAAHEALVRPAIGPDAFERYWRWAALAMLQGANAPDAAQPFVDRALARFPDEPRFVLARAFLADQRHPLGEVPAAHAGDVLKLYDAAIALPDARPEAQIRKAWLLHRLERHAEALALLDSAGDVPDGALRYLRHFRRGQGLEALARPDAAVEAYRAALAIAPEAQSPKVALMALLLKQGDRRGAEALATEIETAPVDALDPAWAYWLGDYRSFPDIIRRLREQTR